MMQHLRGAVAVALLTAAAAAPAAAQVFGLPVHASGVVSGAEVAAHVGFVNDDGGAGTAYGAGFRLGNGWVGGGVLVARHSPDEADARTSYGANVNVRVFGGPLMPVSVSVLGGVGYASIDGDAPAVSGSLLRVPAAVSVAAVFPNAAFSLRPWIAPRLDLLRVAPDEGEAETSTDFGLSAGVELNTISGIGLHAAYDFTSREGARPGVFGIGAHYAFRVAGL